MGAKEIREQLDAEIQSLETMIYGKQTPEEPAESVAADQSAQGVDVQEDDAESQAATESPAQPSEHATFDVDQQPLMDDDEDQEEPTNQKKRVSWKNRFIKLKQYHDSEKYKDRKLIGSLYDQLTAKDNEISRLNSMVLDLTKAQPKSVRDFATPEEIDAIGEEELSTMQRLTAQAVENSTAELKAKLSAAEKREQEARIAASLEAKQQAYNIFLERLNAIVPDYAEIDQDARFEAWLQQSDPISGFKRFDLFKQAENSGDVGRVAGFFQEFKKLVNRTLERQVTPVGNSATAQPKKNTQGQPEIVPLASYEQFMEDVTRGRFKGREAEAKKWEAYFDKALQEGRIR